jgi:hypothetical protein
MRGSTVIKFCMGMYLSLYAEVEIVQVHLGGTLDMLIN